MSRAYITSLFAGAFLLGMATAALAVTGEYSNMCTMGLALGKDIQTEGCYPEWVDFPLARRATKGIRDRRN